MQTEATKGKTPTAPTVEVSSVNNPNQKGINMDNSTEASAIRAITVPFHGASLHVIEQNGQPYTPMKPIVEGMGLTWHGQHAKIKANTSRWGVLELRIPSGGGLQSMLCTPLRKLPGWLTTIEPGKVKNPEVRARVIDYQNECDDALWRYWNEGAAFNPRIPAAPSQPAIDYARITPAQAQHLKELVQLVAASGKQGHGETWARLHRKMKVNSYLELTDGQFEEARRYLNGKMDDTSMAVLIQKHFPGGVLTAIQAQAAPVPQYKPLEPGKLVVDRAKLAAIWVDLGRLRQRLDGLGVMASDLPPSWWQEHAISQ